MTSIRNIAIIAHVDHGKTTLVDRMLQSTGTFRAGQEVRERVMDSDPQERERGITIFSKNAAIRWRDPDGREFKLNLVDTPGHADFGGEVERILRMVDGVLLLVDAFEGPMPQTRFVTRKALELRLQPVVVINKVDRTDAEPLRVHDEVLELLMELEADAAQLDAPFLYASGREGWAGEEPDIRDRGLEPLFRTIVRTVPPPPGDPEGPFRMLVSTLDYSPYLGRLAIGRIEGGRIAVGDRVAVWPLDEEEPAATDRVPKLYVFEGLERREAESVVAGEIAAVAGVEGAEIGTTLCDPVRPGRLEGIAVEPPTIAVELRPNDSPFSGRSGRYVTSRQIRERLERETLSNVALRLEPTGDPDRFRVAGRGELHLAVVMESMRRQGYEFTVSRPEVITHQGPEGLEEPYEEVVIDVPAEAMGVVIQKLGERRGEMVDISREIGGTVRLRFLVPSRGLTGYRSEFLTDTRGEGILHRQFARYGPWAGSIEARRTGALVSMTEGTATGYALFNLQDRGRLFVGPGDAVYDGMIVGEHARENDLEVNTTRGKKLTNMRAAGSDENILLEPPREVTLEFGLEFIREDELVEVTPAAIRFRKRALTAHGRKRDRRQAAT
ncbi:MAG: translational GTPase TypA [Candidatus Palauibacterales bacterium]|nr:translational GTPase TypA [Candidatus Palauibacterales bacterium]MDP2529783.1 translational GTPase TypA [Candidatus Palauibacterales bacterium]MDP2585138.1 translational GTPase TypA [Candidatus Palauibacterales bacterium]